MTQKQLNPTIAPQIMTTLPYEINESSDQLKFRNDIPNHNYEINTKSNEYQFSSQSSINYQNSNLNSHNSQEQISPSLRSSLNSCQTNLPKSNQSSTSFLKSNTNNISTTGKQSSSQKQKKIRKLFSVEEDHLLTRIMHGQPFTTWIAVAEQIPGRSARQCRDRWANYLSPNNKNGPWSQAEDEILAAKQREYGSQWSLICKFFNGRSENNVKNRWYTHLKPKYFPENQINNFTKIRSKQKISTQLLKKLQKQENNKNNDFNFLSYCSNQPISGPNSLPNSLPITRFPSSSQIIDMNQNRVKLPPISSFVPEIPKNNQYYFTYKNNIYF